VITNLVRKRIINNKRGVCDLNLDLYVQSRTTYQCHHDGRRWF